RVRGAREIWPGFDVRDITGACKGTTVCYCCRYGYRPVVAIFARELDSQVMNLVQKIDARVDENQDKRLAAFVILLKEDAEAFEPRIKALAKDARLANTPLTIAVRSPPPAFKIPEEADVTVLMWIEKQLKFRRSFGAGELDQSAIESLVAATRTILE